ncbi:hypothetical protein FQB35_01925 [Crassaminicella thermophila]|uniref:Uncharacterized protein n=1 Tax=Crassaminicella thermophila TaxID=2599308 RepID=A0A5C0SDB8_CRATE|nr:hypothetical protein [Crassaminicella thermophila]QEK11224.1 hypothetical protein FQB35_01925 [Crassaminicella thermophila]
MREYWLNEIRSQLNLLNRDVFDDEKLINRILAIFSNNFEKFIPNSYHEGFIDIECSKIDDIDYEDILEYNIGKCI